MNNPRNYVPIVETLHEWHDNSDNHVFYGKLLDDMYYVVCEDDLMLFDSQWNENWSEQEFCSHHLATLDRDEILQGAYE